MLCPPPISSASNPPPPISIPSPRSPSSFWGGGLGRDVGLFKNIPPPPHLTPPPYFPLPAARGLHHLPPHPQHRHPPLLHSFLRAQISTRGGGRRGGGHKWGLQPPPHPLYGTPPHPALPGSRPIEVCALHPPLPPHRCSASLRPPTYGGMGGGGCHYLAGGVSVFGGGGQGFRFWGGGGVPDIPSLGSL